MKAGLYLKLAVNNIRKNYRFFIPRILAEAGLLACFYISFTIWQDDRLRAMRGGYRLPTFMAISTGVLAILSVVLMLYVNSFLMKQRTHEFGMYNVLGMEKRHINRVLFRETLISSLLSVLLGLVLGVVFYKLNSLLICRLLQEDLVLGFYYITPRTLIPSGLFFLAIDLFTYLVNCIRIHLLKPVDLLKDANAGEKEPKVRWIMLVAGVLTLGWGYWLALTIKNPVKALNWFFIAVVLVMIGTYFLFVAGSIFVLKAMKNNQRFYYQRRHMPAVSGMLYRMKQNAVGLASISLLATGVIVMLSTTVALYTGYESTLNRNYPEDLYLSATVFSEDDQQVTVDADQLQTIIQNAAEENDLEIETLRNEKYLSVIYYTDHNELIAMKPTDDSVGIVDEDAIDDLISTTFVTASEYERLTGKKVDLKDDEIAVCQFSSSGGDILDLNQSVHIAGRNFRVKETLKEMNIGNHDMDLIVSSYGIVVKDDAVLEMINQDQIAGYGADASVYTERIAVTFADELAAEKKDRELYDAISTSLKEMNINGMSYDYSARWEAKQNLLSMYGTLLFLGILLGFVCLFATTLIIYYKQISEGYEDRDRFQIMEKIGMSQEEVRKTINTQVLMVFLLPLIVAGIHMAFAIPLLNKILSILALYSYELFLTCTGITFAVFAMIYVLIYKATSKTYYQIVH